MLKKDIRKSLLEIKEKKNNLLIEQSIIKNRIKSIFNSSHDMKYFNSLPKKQKLIYSISLIKEIHEMHNLGLISEDETQTQNQTGQGFSFMDILQLLFGRAFNGVIETAAEPLIGSILTKIGFKSDGFMKKFMISALTSKPSQLIAALGDCKALTRLLVESFVEANVMLLQKEFSADSFIFNSIRNTLSGAMKETSFVQGIESKIETYVCDMFDSFTDRAQDVIEKLKSQTS